MKTSHSYAAICCSAIFAVSLAGLNGCSSAVNPEKMLAEANNSNLRRLANLYSVYQMKNDWRGPADEATFKKYISEQSPTRMSRIGVDVNAVDELFVSDRDGAAFKIRWGITGSGRGPARPVIFEAKGVEGKFQVGFTGNEMKEVDKTEYDQLWQGMRDGQIGSVNQDRGDARR